ncbi:uncharacterized protein [Physcomitrium patens]|uniref:Uncharacterized protein n=1 Tax=Physcomitrium patens TaxID=3218 RepID=A0A2K1IP57_PHYPA|nr:uncharacterized protein LOC112274668 [Physcomitrium patens]PNR31038.1 hypothetical protein PHYPA_027354 [Physcomitrium patens]|eukprot:XP_024360098.1 uncharacterized protein LOC112274668 [Physcomitrella patens]
MDRILHRNLSSCGQTVKFVTNPCDKRTQSLTSLPCVRCGLRTEEILPSKRTRFSSSSSWSYFQVFGDVHGCMNASDSRACQTVLEHTLQRAGSSRVLAAWEKIQSWNPIKHNIGSKSRGEAISTESSLVVDDETSGLPDSASRIKAVAGTGQSRDFNFARVISPPSREKTQTRRQLAEAAISQALTPSLRPRRHGEGELGLRMANFLSAFMSSARTNEARFCEERVSKSLQSMVMKSDAAEREVKAIQSWIDDAEDQLHAMPSERDIEWLETLLEKLVCPTQVEKASRSWRLSKDEFVQDQRQQFLQTSADFKYTLANLPTLAEIQKLHEEFEQIDRKLWQCSDAAKEAVTLLRSAIARGEVAWLRNLELDAAYLDALARTVIPLEELFITNSYEFGCHLDDPLQKDS